MEKVSIDELEKLPYEDKRKLYLRLFSLGNFGADINNKLILISLVSLTYLKMKEKNKDLTPMDILIKITGEKDKTSYFYQALEGLSILVEDFCYAGNLADSCGLKSSQEIINKIKEILSTWLPF